MSTATSSSILLSGGTIIAFNEEAGSLEVIRDGALLVTDDHISGIYNTAHPSNLPENTEIVDCTHKIISPGFVDTHRHGWQTAIKTLTANTTLPDYMFRYAAGNASGYYTAEDVYIGQLAGLLEALNAGVTTSLDHAHHIWSKETSEAGLKACDDSGARVYWNCAFSGTPTYPCSEQIADFKKFAEPRASSNGLTTLGVAYDGWSFSPPEDTKAVVALTKELNIPVLTAHYLGGPWTGENIPELLQTLGLLNTDMAVVLSHAMGITPTVAAILRSTNQFISITPESELHYGHGHPNSHQIQDQASLGVDTFHTFSTDLLTQARIWLQRTRARLYDQVLERWEIPKNNPMSVNQAFLLATRQGGLALRRPDLGVIRVGAKADLVVFDGRTPGMLGWRDPVAAVILHANVGDIQHVLVDGKFRKRDGKLTFENYDSVIDRFLASAERVQKAAIDRPDPVIEGRFWGGCPYGLAAEVDASRGSGTGYGKQFLHKD
ncbi:amidohydrolase family protein [Annulohypoxylon maeteangense]|uniref:amidohydrolase family protein n=1 Tax=Annulohypoxylon maeteangense TaxID=1927788 RepID=UPI002008C433|nr:amidohydrolase family protein [Annulohypoxylon maeteangense]KAI0887891.1 amidohydrolase family protein [Annulohypoxylon maeteangense]